MPNVPTPPSIETDKIDHANVQPTMGGVSDWITTDQLESAREKPQKRWRKAADGETEEKVEKQEATEQASTDEEGFPTMASIQATLNSFSVFDTRHYDDAGNHLLTVVDVSGIHIVAICPCKCPQQSPFWAQLLQIGLYPATQKSPRTAFTFQSLESFRLMNLECKVMAMSFYKYLRRVTNPIVPHSTLDRYKELLHISRQWRYLQNKLAFGFAHDSTVEVKDGDLAYFCPACPQPGVNLSEDWTGDLGGAWKYSRSFVMDVNFSAEHTKLKNDNDFDLTGRSGYFTALSCYRAHLQISDDKQPKSTCHEHKAVNQVHATQKHLAATGIGAIACARHGCFVPDTVVDFQKGKQQVNMDYVLCQALGKLEGIPRAAVIYDITCQFSVPFGTRVLKSDYLKFSDSIQMIWGIRLFHIHGHQDVCLSRYIPDLIPGIGKSLSRKYIQAIQALEITEEGYRNLTENADQSLITQWIAQAEEAQTWHFTDITAMDIFDVQLQCGRDATAAGRRSSSTQFGLRHHKLTVSRAED
ncbi:hypothetical protein PAXRUDRAFT_18623 [Paxillus rubicundulus Ve08.2h10]|uniref:CxC2-like cysteine cluster KDZ transposase-associated domain-containing protein n=1 Tax=Paxillus rubicundulus Ve08.2h10 TaxID=930991 RepID=A0A0D0CKU7_9AGAM|nr:hypothetical protein PAXRUDRAFT_18623 [Paxillus rubicundulus Ve08.2h10]